MTNGKLYDVAIVGCCPVGATLAILLAQYGLSIAVVEQTADIYDKPRAITIDHESANDHHANQQIAYLL
jgi:3-(3-hydroxy-phenyl)propionate hydroxylase